MRKIILSLILLFSFSSFIFSQNVSLDEKFETGLPASASSAETTVTLSSGDWKIKGVNSKSDNGSVRAAMTTSGYMITPPIDKPVQVSFNHRGSGSGKILTVEKSIDSGTTWHSIGSATVNSSSAYGSSSISVGEPGTRGVLIRFTCGSATIYVDNVIVTGSNLVEEPTVQANIAASEVTGSSMKINFTKGDGDNRLLAYSKGEAASWTPTDGESYTKLPKNVDNNVIAAYFGNDDFTVITGLEAGETYHFAVFEANGNNEGCNYLTSTIGRLEQPTAQVPSITLQSAQMNFGQVKTGTSSKRSFNISAKYLEPVSGEIEIVSSADFLISTNSAEGFVQSLSISYSNALLESTTVYVQFLPTELREYSHTITLAGGNATGEIQMLGTGSDTDAKTYYISPLGNDNGEGTYDSPWYNLQKAIDAAVAGDFIICRGGTYYPNMKKDGTKTTVRITNSGTSDKRTTIMNYPDEFPVLNFRDQPKKQSVRGIQLDGNYWHIYGLHITEAGDNGIKLEGNHNIIEQCTFSYNDDTGIQLGFGHNFSDTHPGISKNDGSYCSYNYIIDCDSYLNCDSDNFGSDADGFACKMHNGLENWFIRCRAWDNADDAWDLYETDFPVYIIDCWAWGSGRASLFDWVSASGSFQGNGNGIKLGGNGTGGSSKGKHEVWNSVAFNCNKTGSVKGFDQNSHKDGVKVVNSLAFGNGYDFMFETASDMEFYNNVCLGKLEIANGSESNNALTTSSSKGWLTAITGISASDYVDLSEDAAKAPRGEDGSLPEKFARLRESSNLIGGAKKGLIAPLPAEIGENDVFGSALKPRRANKDIGPFDYNTSGEETQVIINPFVEFDLSIYPNPVSINATIKLGVKQDMQAAIAVYDLQGRIVLDLGHKVLSGGTETLIPLHTEQLISGVYLVSVTAGNEKLQRKLIIQK